MSRASGRLGDGADADAFRSTLAQTSADLKSALKDGTIDADEAAGLSKDAAKLGSEASTLSAAKNGKAIDREEAGLTAFKAALAKAVGSDAG